MQCGHELGASRTCPDCGTTAPVEPLPAPQLPPAGVRYPLFADEVDSVSVTTSGHVLTAPVTEPVGMRTAPPPPPPASTTEVRLPAVAVVPPRRRAGAVVWSALVVLVVAVLAFGAWLVLHDGSGDSADSPGASSGASTSAGASRDVAATATAVAPLTRAPGQDTAGNETAYDASNMLDGDKTTSWQMPGDGTGKELTFTLAKQTHLTEVGLVNGYAKTSKQGGKTLDWYAGNRRILKVEWLFDDGTTQTQDLRQITRMQTTAVDATTTTVKLRLLEVSGPGTGAAARNFTAISEVGLTGTTD
jgi:hypothetical protein